MASLTPPSQRSNPPQVSGGIDLRAILDELLGGYRAGQEERQEDKASGISALMEAIGLFDASYGKGTEKRAQAKFAQSASSRGLAGSTVPAAISTGLGQEFEDMRRGRLGGALSNLAQFLSSFDAQRPTAGTIAHTATGGFGALANVSAQNVALNQPRDLISGNQAGLGYQPPSSSGLRSAASSPFRGRLTTSGSAGTGGSAWGGLQTGISQQQQQASRTTGPTFSGMIAGSGTEHEATDYSSWLYSRTTPDWAEEAALGGGTPDNGGVPQLPLGPGLGT